MGIFDFEENTDEKIGTVESVDTANIVIKIDNEELLRKMQVNHLIVVQSSKVGRHLLALVNKIMRNSAIEAIDNDDQPLYKVDNVVKATLIGTHIDKEGTRTNVFKRTLESVPEINSDCFILEGDRLTDLYWPRFQPSIFLA